MRKLTKAQRGLVALINAGFTIRAIHRSEARSKGLVWAFDAARRAGLIQSAGYETSVAAEDWLGSEAGRKALEAPDA